ncbi:hypothetical protein PUNSTDRAFT_44052 [Punctularia strigosozonata HHB-11173 SS5]|uniref:uncharacterized protein n=1 Tax=Punctularia strigosozonata (strain HHB-11173) TaxID=741275 RepID=UPI0004417332|nr:uncharacterized protein PUNSTDRAFT_44052 [Punctularia strigosozonata HHB-11173 SS5]EIN09797.1 hypothetical protein PUNSTDRAFT_44052 [Punctularia strigosozonata HHB-11173 SS5]
MSSAPDSSSPYANPYFHSQLSFASSTNATASDLSGAGRVLGTLFSWGGRHLEHVVAGSPHPDPHVQHDADADAVTIELTFASGSNSTISNIDGHGRALGRAMAWGGRVLERWALSTSERLGRGPSAPMIRILNAMARARGTRCSVCGLETPSSSASSTTKKKEGKKKNAEVRQMLHLCVDVRCAGCRASYAEAMAKSGLDVGKCFRGLVKMLNSRNPSSRVLAVQYIAILAVTHPEFRARLLELGVDHRLRQICEDRRRLVDADIDSLLAPAQRALIALSETRVLVIRKEFDAAYESSLRSPSQTLVNYYLATVYVPELDVLESAIRALVSYTTHADMCTVAISCLTAITDLLADDAARLLLVLDAVEEDFYLWLWLQAATSRDPVWRTAVHKYVESLYTSPGYFDLKTWSVPARPYDAMMQELFPETAEILRRSKEREDLELRGVSLSNIWGSRDDQD